MSKQLLLGDEAIAQAALDAGLSGVYAYPGTPSTEITEYMQMAPITTEQNIHLSLIHIYMHFIPVGRPNEQRFNEPTFNWSTDNLVFYSLNESNCFFKCHIDYFPANIRKRFGYPFIIMISALISI